MDGGSPGGGAPQKIDVPLMLQRLEIPTIPRRDGMPETRSRTRRSTPSPPSCRCSRRNSAITA